VSVQNYLEARPTLAGRRGQEGAGRRAPHGTRTHSPSSSDSEQWEAGAGTGREEHRPRQVD